MFYGCNNAFRLNVRYKNEIITKIEFEIMI